MSLISVVIPAYNEASCLDALFTRLKRLQQAGGDGYEFIFVDDGSTDGSDEIIRKLASANDNVKYMIFSRNFGHEAATTAGLDHAAGDAAVIIDADLQDPPEVIPELIEKWRQGYQIVYAQRRSRKGESWRKRLSSWLFYRIIRRLSDVDIPVDTGDFRLIDRAVLDEFRKCREHDRFVRILLAWTGYRQTGVLYDRDVRYAGKSKYGMLRLIILALDVVLGASNLPLRLGILSGLCVFILSLVMIAIIVVRKLFFGIQIPGYALLVTGIFFLGGMQLLLIGLVGEYVGRIFRQTQQRPLYIVAEKSPALSTPETPSCALPVTHAHLSPKRGG
jgi:polyisoprenyl-phosphate glycosyltransferase